MESACATVDSAETRVLLNYARKIALAMEYARTACVIAKKVSKENSARKKSVLKIVSAKAYVLKASAFASSLSQANTVMSYCASWNAKTEPSV